MLSKGKLVEENDSLKAKMAVLRVNAASKKVDADVRKLKIKKEIDELAIVHAKQRLDEKIALEREKEDIKKRQLESKTLVLKAS